MIYGFVLLTQAHTYVSSASGLICKFKFRQMLKHGSLADKNQYILILYYANKLFYK